MTPGFANRSRAVRRPLGLPARVAIGFGAAICALGLAVVSSALSLNARNDSARRVARTAAARLALEELESTLLVSHAALDSYVGTGDQRHRRRHLRAVSEIGPALDEVATLAERGTGEQAELERLRTAVESTRAGQRDALALADAGRLAEAGALHDGVGAAAYEHAREILESLERVEALEAQERQLGWGRSVATSNAVFFGAHAVLLVLILLAARLVRDEIRARQENEAEREQALVVQRRLMAVVSHDLRNPLNGILAAGWSLSRASLEPAQARLVHRVIVAGRRMERLIRDLLDWSRVHGGMEIPIAPIEADLHEVCERIAGELSDRNSSRVQLVHEGDTRAVFDTDRMEQVVANLVGNALKYSAPDAPVRVRVAGEGGEVRLEVHDEGPGIPPAAMRELFAPFQRSVKAGTDDGSGLGLGLFIVRTLAEAQGARIEVDSTPERGTTFVVHLPRHGP